MKHVQFTFVVFLIATMLSAIAGYRRITIDQVSQSSVTQSYPKPTNHKFN